MPIRSLTADRIRCLQSRESSVDHHLAREIVRKPEDYTVLLCAQYFTRKCDR